MAKEYIFQGARRVDDFGGIPIPSEISTIVGDTETLITRPIDIPNPGELFLALRAENNPWRLRPGDYVGRTVTPQPTTNDFDATSHGYVTGFGPVRVTAGTTLPTGVAADTDFFVRVIDDDTFALYTSLEAALAGGPSGLVTFSDAGTGTIIVGGPANGGDGNGWANAVTPAAAITEYSSHRLEVADGILVIPAPSKITVVAFNATDALSFWFF